MASNSAYLPPYAENTPLNHPVHYNYGSVTSIGIVYGTVNIGTVGRPRVDPITPGNNVNNVNSNLDANSRESEEQLQRLGAELHHATEIILGRFGLAPAGNRNGQGVDEADTSEEPNVDGNMVSILFQ